MKLSLLYLFAFALLGDFPTVLGTFMVNHINITRSHLVSSKLHPSTSEKVKKRDLNQENEYIFSADLNNDGRPLTIVIKQRDSDILTANTTFEAIFQNHTQIQKPSVELYEGYVREFPTSSAVNGYVQNFNFYGHVYVNDTLYYVDQSGGSNRSWTLNFTNGPIEEKNALIFKKDSVIVGLLLTETKSAKTLFNDLVRSGYYSRQFKEWKGQGKLCPMVVLIDHSFVTIVHKGNADAATFHVLFSLEEANAIFRSTDFDNDGQPDNIGFYVKKIVVLHSNEARDYLLPYHPGIQRVTDYLVQFMRYPELKYHCLGMVFTGQKFDRGTLGASYTPDSTSLHPLTGICDGFIPKMGTMNGLVITASTVHSPLVNQMIFEVTIAHELGHSFGSSHDGTPQCFGYIMAPKSFKDYYFNRTHVTFSPCSREQMMRTLVAKGDCFEPVQTSFCGNGMVEEGEDCDCGLTRDCLLRDPCCVPRRTRQKPCKINKKDGHQCHPSQGQCCTENCRYSTALDQFVTCDNFDLTCPCPTYDTGKCECGLNGKCIGNECHNIECSRLGLKECHCQHGQFCQICCQYRNNCVPAIEATNHLITAENIQLSQVNDEVAYQAKRFITKRFCRKIEENQCVSLRFMQTDSGDFCLYRGNLGRCKPNYRCEVFQSRQSFPSFDNASPEYLQTFYFVLNFVLIQIVFN